MTPDRPASPSASLPPRRWLRRTGVAVALLLLLLGIAWAMLRVDDIPVATLRTKYGSPASRYVELAPGTIIHLRDEGPRDGFPVVLLHGSNASLHTWQPWVDRLSGKYRLIRFDFPGHGLSSPVPSADYSSAAYVAITEKVVTHLGLKRFALGGNSMGGSVAWRYAGAHPDQVAALILVDSAGQPYPQGSTPPIGFRIARMPILRDIATSVTPRSLIEDSLLQTVSVKSIVTPAMVDRYWELLRYPGNREATLQRFAAYHPQDDTTVLKRITAPTVIIWGRDDKLIPASSASWFSGQLPNSRVTILEHVGHIPMEEAPDRALAPVLPLLERVSAAPGVSPRDE